MIEETIENQEIEETSDSEQETEEKKPEIADEGKKKIVTQKEFDKVYARAKIAEEKLKEAEPKKLEGEDEWKSKVEFLLQNRDYSEEEFDHLSTVAARKGISLSDAAKETDDYIQFRREKVAQEKKVPGSTSPESGSFEEKKITKDTPEEDVDKILQERFKREQEKPKSGV